MMFCKNVASLYERYDAFLIDVYGVLYNGSDFFDGVLNLMLEMKKAGKKLIILSNTTMVAEACEKKYQSKGLTKDHYDVFVSSGEAFKQTLPDHIGEAQTYFTAFAQNTDIFVGSHLERVESIEKADFVYVGALNSSRKFYIADAFKNKNGEPIAMENLTSLDCHDISDFEEITSVLDSCLKYHKPLVIANPDIFALELISTNEFSERRPVLCQGAIGEFYEHLGGDVIYFGKPYPAIYDYAKKFISPEEKTVMIGDTLWTDILGGNMAGIDTTLTLTGVSGQFMKNFGTTDIETGIKLLLSEISSKMTHKSLANLSQTPTHIVGSFA